MKRKETRRCLHQDTNSFITPSLHLCSEFCLFVNAESVSSAIPVSSAIIGGVVAVVVVLIISITIVTIVVLILKSRREDVSLKKNNSHKK